MPADERTSARRSSQALARHGAALLFGVATVLIAGCAHSFTGAVFDPPCQPYDIALTDHEDRPWRLSDQRDRVTVLYFGFASCPDVCPQSLATLAAARKKLGADGARVQGVLVTLDPDRDSTAVLKHYVAAFDPTFVGLRGSQQALDPILKAYSVTATRRPLPDSVLGYTIDHTSYFYAIDLGGCYREMLKGSTPVDGLAADLRFLATERQPRSCR